MKNKALPIRIHIAKQIQIWHNAIINDTFVSQSFTHNIYGEAQLKHYYKYFLLRSTWENGVEHMMVS